MLQRIQTVFLLISTVLIILMFCFPMATAAESVIQYSDSIVLFLLLLISTLVSFFNILLYRHRIVQIRLCTFNILVLIALQAVIVFYLFSWEGVKFSFTAVFPIIAAILTFLAMRYIARDEAMIRSLNRLRK